MVATDNSTTLNLPLGFTTINDSLNYTANNLNDDNTDDIYYFTSSYSGYYNIRLTSYPYTTDSPTIYLWFWLGTDTSEIYSTDGPVTQMYYQSFVQNNEHNQYYFVAGVTYEIQVYMDWSSNVSENAYYQLNIELQDNNFAENPVNTNDVQYYTLNDRIDYVYDADYYKFTSTGTAYNIFTTGYPTNINSIGWLYECSDSSCSSSGLTEVAYDDDHGYASSYNGFIVRNINDGLGQNDFGFQVDLQNYANKTFLVKVEAYSYGIGNYSFHINALDTNTYQNPENLDLNLTNSSIDFIGDANYFTVNPSYYSNDWNTADNAWNPCYSQYYKITGSDNISISMNTYYNIGYSGTYSPDIELFGKSNFHSDNLSVNFTRNLVQLNSTYQDKNHSSWIYFPTSESFVVSSNYGASNENYSFSLSSAIMPGKKTEVSSYGVTVEDVIFYYYDPITDNYSMDAYFYNRPVSYAPSWDFVTDIAKSESTTNIMSDIGFSAIIGTGEAATDILLFTAGIDNPYIDIGLIPLWLTAEYVHAEKLFHTQDNVIQSQIENHDLYHQYLPERITFDGNNKTVTDTKWDGIHFYYNPYWGNEK